MPTLGEFIWRARGYGFTRRRVGFDLHGPRGVTHIEYLWREKPPPPAYAPLPDDPHETRLDEDQVRSLCAQLRIPPEDFGLEA
jgi:hypothetical protein